MKSDDFKVGHTWDACTAGIMMSTSVLESEQFAIVVLDTEGMGDATEKGSKQNVLNYLILTTLLCSYLIFNMQGALNETHLQQMR